MPCYHPVPAFRQGGVVCIGRPRRGRAGDSFFAVPCGSCVGCRESRSRDWTIRCQLEAQYHADQSWCTLTYDPKSLPPTLDKEHLSGFVKRLRNHFPAKSVKFFASGEYGEKNGRPHYHSVLFGVRQGDPAVQKCWPFGVARSDALSDAAIAYVCGYVAKKWGRYYDRAERVDPDTGEVFVFQPPFVLMSRRPGIAARARTDFRASWRSCAIVKGRSVPVPRYLHAGWSETASDVALAELETERELKMLAVDVSPVRLNAAEAIAKARLSLSRMRREL